jgi:hypothetical protein
MERLDHPHHLDVLTGVASEDPKRKPAGNQSAEPT